MFYRRIWRLYLLSDSVCNYVIDLILVLMESNGFVGYVAAFDHFMASGTAKRCSLK